MIEDQNLELLEKIQKLEEIEVNRDVIISENIKKLLENKNQKLEIYEKELHKLVK